MGGVDPSNFGVGQKMACLAWVHKILAWVRKIVAWVAWVCKIGVGRDFDIGQENDLCQNKMEFKINIFQIFMVCMSCYFIILYRNYCVLCRL